MSEHYRVCYNGFDIGNSSQMIGLVRKFSIKSSLSNIFTSYMFFNASLTLYNVERLTEVSGN